MIPADRINPVAQRILQFYPVPNATRPASRGRQPGCAEHFNDQFWNSVGKVDHNFGANDRVFGRWGKNERNEFAQHLTRFRGSGPVRPAAAHPRQPRHRRRLGPRVRQRHRVQRARRYTDFLEWSQSDGAFGFDSTEFVARASSRSCRARDSAACSRASHWPSSSSLSRGTEHEPQRELVAPAEHLDDQGPAQHPLRPRPAPDQGRGENYNNAAASSPSPAGSRAAP